MGRLFAARAQQGAGVVLLLFGLAVCWQTNSLSVGQVNRPGPGFFPLVLGGVLVLLGVWVAFEARLLAGAEHSAAPAASTGSGRVALVSALILAFSLLLEPLGYLVSMLMLILLLLRLAGRGWRLSVLLALATTLLSHLLFDRLLGIPLPSGLLEALA